MGLICAKLCFLCMGTERREGELRAIQHNNAENSRMPLKCLQKKEKATSRVLDGIFQMNHLHYK